jgi:lipopolysaccharide export system protein LptA
MTRSVYAALLTPFVALFAALFLAPTPGLAQAPQQDKILLSATNCVLELEKGVYHLWDHVRVESPGTLLITCEDLRAALPQDKAQASAGPLTTGGKLQSLVASGNVVIELFQPGANGSTNVVRAFGKQAEYGSQEEILILTGEPRIETPSGTMIGTEALIYDLKSRTMRNRGSYRIELKADILKGSTLFNRGTNTPKSR